MSSSAEHKILRVSFQPRKKIRTVSKLSKQGPSSIQLSVSANDVERVHRESTSPALTVAAASGPNPYIPEAVTHTHQQHDQDHVIIMVKDASGCYRLGRAILVSCSQINFITDEFAQRFRTYA